MTAAESMPAGAPPTAGPVGRRGPAVLLAGLLLAATAFWLWLALSVHTLLVIGGECDCYIDRAADLLQGQVRQDGFHPLGMPLLIAAVSLLGPDTFLAGRLVAIASGLLLLGCTYAIARTFASRKAAVLAAVAVGASKFVLLGAVQACTDVPAAAFAALALWCWTEAAACRRTTAGFLFLGGLALGLAGFMRTPSLMFAPAFLPVLLRVSWRERLRRLGLCLLGVTAGFGPHLGLSWFAGSPLQNASQLVWKYRGLSDDELIEHLRAPGPFPWAEVPGWLLQGGGDLLGYLGGGMAAPWGLAAGPVAVAASLLMTAAIALPLLLRHTIAGVLALGAAAYAVAMCVFTLPVDRLTVPMAMPVVLLSMRAWSLRPRSWTGTAVLGSAAVLAAAALVAAPRAVDYFEKLHPRAELQAVQQLVAEHGEWISVATPVIGLDKHSSCFFVQALPLPPGDATPARHWAQLLASPRAAQADFVLLGRDTTPEPYAALATAPPPRGYEVLRRDDVLLVARVDAGPEWCAEAEVVVRGDECRLRLRLTAAVDRSQLLVAGFLVRDAKGQWQRLSLQPGADGDLVATVPGGRLVAAGGYRFVPALMTKAGIVRRGGPVEARVEAGAGTPPTNR